MQRCACKQSNGYQIVSGHHRKLAADAAGSDAVPCWVRAMDDGEAYMALVLANTQGELHPLEEGKHAEESGLDLKAYAEAVGKSRTTLVDKVKAYRVLASVTHMRHEPRGRWRCLSEIHAASSWLWPALAAELAARGWTVEATRGKVAAVRDVPEPAAWVDAAVDREHRARCPAGAGRSDDGVRSTAAAPDHRKGCARDG